MIRCWPLGLTSARLRSGLILLLGSFGSLDPSGKKLPWEIEREASLFYRKHDFVAAILAEDCGPGYVRHLGDDRHVPEVRGPAAGGSR